MLPAKRGAGGFLACKANVSYYVWRIDPQWAPQHTQESARTARLVWLYNPDPAVLDKRDLREAPRCNLPTPEYASYKIIIKKIITPNVIISGRRAAMFQMFQRVMAQISAVCRHAMDLLEELSGVPTSLSPPLIPFCTWLCGQSWNLTKRAAVQFTGQEKKSRLLLMFAPRRKSHLFDAASDQWHFLWHFTAGFFCFFCAARCPLWPL